MPFFGTPTPATPADVDDQGHVNNVIYVRWMQDAAAAHWQAAAGAELRATVFWVVTHHEVEYKAPAFDGERLLARTWGAFPRAPPSRGRQAPRPRAKRVCRPRRRDGTAAAGGRRDPRGVRAVDLTSPSPRGQDGRTACL